MSEAARLRIRGWKKFQHYKHRKPPWIRLYRELLEDPDWMSQRDEAKALLCELWMVASDTDDGSLPAIEALAWRLRRSCESVTSALALINPKFIDGASMMLAGCRQDATSEYRVEQSRVELQSRAETEVRAINGTDLSLPDPVEIDRLDADIADEEKRFNSLALPIRDEIQSVLDALPRPKDRSPFSATRWLRTGMTGIPRSSGGLTVLRLINDALEARQRQQAEPVSLAAQARAILQRDGMILRSEP